MSVNSVQRKQSIDQSLWVLTCQSDMKADMDLWLQDSALINGWQSTTDLSEIRQALLCHTHNNVLLDMRTSPHQMLTHLRYLKEHFVDCSFVALVDQQNTHWGKQALQNGAHAYVSLQDISGIGLSMLLHSLQLKPSLQSVSHTATDTSTGLIDAPLFFDRLNHGLQVAVRHNCRSGILLVSLDGYDELAKNSNHELLSDLLTQLAKRLSTTIRNSDSLGKISEGLFAVLLEDLHDEVMVTHIAQDIQQQFENEFHVHNQIFNLSVSIGGHLCEPGELNGAALYRQTEKALGRAIESGKQGMWFYIQDMNFKAMARLNMLQSLERALVNNEFYLKYQPIHAGKELKISGMEPAMCWQHPAVGAVMPDVFMDLLIDSGLIIKAGIWMIEQSCQQISEWENSELQLFIPITEKQLRNNGLVQVLIDQSGYHHITSRQLVLKITEQTAIKNIHVINDLVNRLPSIAIAIELQGTTNGYHSFDYLKKIRADYLCLDPLLFKNMPIDELEVSIVTVVVHLAHSMGMKVLANGADSQYQVDNMLALGCDALQGDCFSQLS